jgi:peptidyl-prolyl cis-trans isomerase A (cyclophilin A)
MTRMMTAGMALALTVPSIAGAQTGGPDTAKLKTPAALTEKAPDVYRAKFDTSKGAFIVTVHRAWAPLGADRFYNLVKNGFYDECRFFRVLDGFMAQIGMNGDPAVQRAWQPARLQDDPVKESNKRGYVTFAHAGPNSRTTQFFINFGDNAASLDKQGFPPIGQVTTGMEVVDKLYSGYGEGAPRGSGPSQGTIASEGNAYLTKQFPKLDYVKKATIEK